MDYTTRQIYDVTEGIQRYFENDGFTVQVAGSWMENAMMLRTSVERIGNQLKELIGDEALPEIVEDYVDDIVHEYYEDKSFGKALVFFREFVKDSVTPLTESGKIPMNVNDLVENILSGVDIKQMLLESNPLVEVVKEG